MDRQDHICFNAQDRSYFSILKKEIHKIVAEAGFSATKVGEIDIIVAEMTSNLVKHAEGGEILVRLMMDGDAEAIELISIDNGPGMTDPQKMMEDGLSTSSTLGHGLGSMKRLSDVFQIYSLKEWGTIILSRVYRKTPPANRVPPRAEVRSVIVAKPGESVSGDSYCYELTTEKLTLFVGDGLGHGPDANDAVTQAVKAIRKENTGEPVDMLRSLHTSVRKTRGLVGTIAVFNFKDKKWRICGIGNIATRMQNGLLVRNYMSYNGIIGMNIPNTMKDQIVDHVKGQLIIMCSDGIKTRWDTQRYTAIFRYDLAILAAAIYKDYGRRTDDMSVVIARINN
ncbi:MAG: serine/threonine protein kinase [Sphingobacteriales bacterium]|nr:MAG: serine/threonine protein kinase [Sphingobacteriales bacterium]